MSTSDGRTGVSTTLSGPLQSGLSQIKSPNVTGGALGYVFAEPSGRGQLQRWVLYDNPRNTLDVARAPEPMASWTLSSWTEGISSIWRPNSFYVWAQADVYRYGGAYEGKTWTQIPSPTQLPLPTFPPSTGDGFQFDTRPGAIVEIKQEVVRGYLFTVGGLTDESNVEYWLLEPGFNPAGAAAPTSITPGSRTASSLDEFVRFANQRWSAGSSFIITGCNNYKHQLPPPEP